MKVATRPRYATRIMVCLAGMQPGQALTKFSIAKREGISCHYVAQILITLKRAGLVRSQRGAQGGFVLARHPARISVLDVVEAVDGPIAIAPCTEQQPKGCERSAACVTRTVWCRANQALRDLLAGISLQELAEQAQRVGHGGTISFEI